MIQYLELQTSIEILKYDSSSWKNNFNNTTILHRGDILISQTNYSIKEDTIVGAIYKNYNVSEYVKVVCDEYTRFGIENSDFRNDSTLLYMLLNMSFAIDITTQYKRNMLIDEVLSI